MELTREQKMKKHAPAWKYVKEISQQDKQLPLQSNYQFAYTVKSKTRFTGLASEGRRAFKITIHNFSVMSNILFFPWGRGVEGGIKFYL